MLTLNAFTLTGNLATDPVTKALDGDKTVTTARLAFTSGKDHTSFIKLEIWNGKGKAFAEHLSKGNPVYIEGALRIDEYEKDGQKTSMPKIVVTGWQFLAPKKEG